MEASSVLHLIGTGIGGPVGAFGMIRSGPDGCCWMVLIGAPSTVIGNDWLLTVFLLASIVVTLIP